MQADTHISLSQFDAIVFDLGGVILNIDFQATVEAFKLLELRNYDTLYTKYHQNEIFSLLEIGKLSEACFLEKIHEYETKKLTDGQIIMAWNAMILDFPENRIRMLEKVNQTHRTFVLSNTNALHMNRYFADLKNCFGYSSLASLVEKEYYSHLLGMRKPDEEIFLYLLNDSGLDPKSTLFIDDSAANIESAHKCGIQGLLVETNSDFIFL